MENNINSIDARELWKYLEIKTGFSLWFKRKVKESRFVEREDYINIVSPLEDTSNIIPRKDYVLTLDTAKAVAMMTLNHKGKEVRKYFLAAEKEAKKILEAIKKEEEFFEILSRSDPLTEDDLKRLEELNS